jgi:hypothetical protein
MITKIYLVENCYGDPNKIYIGKTKNSRKNDHKKTYGDQIIYTCIDEIESLDRKDWKPLESYWIEQFYQWGFNVQNKNKGGNGPEYHTKETCGKISQGNIGKLKPGVSEKTKGISKIKPPGVGKKIQVSKKLYFENNEHYWGDKISSSMIGKQNRLNTTQPQSQKDKVREALIGRPKSEETIQKMRKPRTNIENLGKHRLGIITSEETKQKQRTSAFNRQTPVIQFSKQGNFIAEYNGINEASRMTGCQVSAIIMCCKNRLKSTKGFIFKYK